MFFSLISCNKNFQEEDNTEIRNDSVTFYFEKSKEISESRQIIETINKSISFANQQDTLLPLLYDYKIYYHTRLKEYDSSSLFAEKLINSGRLNEDTSWIAMGYYRKGKIQFYLGDQEEVFRNSYKSRQLYLAVGDSSKAGRRTLEMANSQSRISDYHGAQENAIEALRLLDEKEDSAYISSAHNLVAMVYRNQGFLEDALREYNEALKFAVKKKDNLTYLNNIALITRDQGNYAKAINSFQDLLTQKQILDKESEARYLDNLAYTKWLQDSTAKVESDFLKALNIRREINDKSGLDASYTHLVEFYRNSNKNEAIKYAKRWLKLTKNSSVQAELEALEKYIELAPASQSNTEVKHYIKLNDSVNQANLVAKNTFAKIRFDEEQKQKEILGLEALTAKQTLETQNLRERSIIISALALLGILGGSFMLYYFRQKHRKEKIQEVHKTESRISKKIHDELANDIYNIMSRLEMIASKDDLDKLERIYTQTRDISRENSEIATDEDFGEMLIINLSHISGNSRLILKGEKSVNWEKFSEEKKIVIYRVLQELMVNMKKHSEAKFVALNFFHEDKKLKISYSDTGKGASLEEIKVGNGLQNVENRILSVKGLITFETKQGEGFKAKIQIPE
ncbi:tetratricopeptide repeat protein [Salegentibacter sp. Hel_I_6]|uniref:tetratricopeptide repeat-containing sensor histidine kinase n=1 Tax=Salegentibacter sp. Hel_I_6 TaxID=1250278 RepID=UPI0018CF9985|nr:tetratricopeptide repeat protein [Salegentibacter sp. Hel_I_6]